jgi:hypothetical protein
MIDRTQGALSEHIRRLSAELKDFDLDLKAGSTPETTLLQDFRQILDNTRLTAWTVSELLNAVESQRDPAMVLSFVAAERLRRSNQMLKDLCSDIDEHGITWQTSGIQSLFETVCVLQLQLGEMIDQHRSRFGKAKEAAR